MRPVTLSPPAVLISAWWMGSCVWSGCHAVRASMLQLARALLAAPLAQTGSHGSHVAERPVPSLTVDSPSFPGVKRYC